jgi:hypothetical protein
VPGRARDDGSLRLALLTAAAAVALQTTVHLLDVYALDERYPSLDASSDRGFAAAAVVAAGAAAALAALALGFRSRRRRDTILLGFLAVILGFLAFDRVAGLHDRLAGPVASALGLPRVAGWPTPAILAPILVPVAIILWTGIAGRSSQRAARAGIVLLGVALALRPIALALTLTSGRPEGFAHQLGIAAKQGLELGGWVVLAVALVTTAARTGAVPRGSARLSARTAPARSAGR